MNNKSALILSTLTIQTASDLLCKGCHMVSLLLTVTLHICQHTRLRRQAMERTTKAQILFE